MICAVNSKYERDCCVLLPMYIKRFYFHFDIIKIVEDIINENDDIRLILHDAASYKRLLAAGKYEAGISFSNGFLNHAFMISQCAYEPHLKYACISFGKLDG